MARTKGTFNISANIETNASAPLDARERVATKADLTASGSFPYFYEGMMVYVVSEQKRYTLKGSDPTVLANWVENGSGGSVTVDTELSDSSTNPVENRAIKEGLDAKADLVDGKIPANQLPSYVDDVIQGYLYNGAFYEDEEHTILITGENGKIYIELTSNKTYRWNGSGYSEISESLALGETSSTAYRGDRGKTAYDTSQTNKTNIGNLSNLQTTAKNNLVAAINEVAGESGGSYTAGNGITIQQNEISTDNMPSTDMSEIVNPLPGCTPRWMKYSTEEQVIGQWIDGKPIYQKTYLVTIPTRGNQTAIVVDATFDRIVNSEISANKVSGNDRWRFGSSASYNVKANDIGVYVDGNTVYIGNNSSTDSYGGGDAYVTLQYTKTTD